MTEQGHHPRGAVKEAVIEWLDKYPLNEDVYYADIADDLGVQQASVSSVLRSIVRADRPQLEGGIVLVTSGRAGRYRKVRPDATYAGTGHRQEAEEPHGPQPGDKMEVVASLRSGKLLLRAGNGAVYTAEEME